MLIIFLVFTTTTHFRGLPSKYSSWWRRLQDISIKVIIFVLVIRFQKTSQDFLVKTNMFVLVIPLQDVFKTSYQDVCKTSCKISSSQLQDVLPRHLQDVFKTSSRGLAKTFSWSLPDVFQKCLQDVFKTYHQGKLFLLTGVLDIFNTFLGCTAIRVIYRRIYLQ